MAAIHFSYQPAYQMKVGPPSVALFDKDKNMRLRDREATLENVIISQARTRR
jgi:hypothetical protein